MRKLANNNYKKVNLVDFYKYVYNRSSYCNLGNIFNKKVFERTQETLSGSGLKSSWNPVFFKSLDLDQNPCFFSDRSLRPDRHPVLGPSEIKSKIITITKR